ncbi:uncharacterized protein A4U43_C04F21640 [Asparagus officinalis]|uniref:Retrovirus-related Pol polyprotein from transposon TNT 1-94 n=1 Tax=Asparagus officinalis TaxID=4686 RepID=A0A5P1F3C7_ASPOF|nr:uncharacterized protein A4U43_C04F21640 [Asparagus officinalis]
MSENQKFKEHLNEFNEITDQLNSVNIQFDDEIQALLIPGQLPESWKGIIISIIRSGGKAKLKFSEVVDMIMTGEIRRQEEGISSSGSALNFESRGKNRNKNKGNSRQRPNSRNEREPKKDKENKTEANIISGESDDALICLLESKTESWVLDSGASFHATSNRDLFENHI